MLNLDQFEGELSRKFYLDCEIIGYIFRWYDTNTCLIRAYCFQNKIVVIASQLSGKILQNRELVSTIIQKLGLKNKHIIWISHVRLSNDYKPSIERFYKSIIKYSYINFLPLQSSHYFQLDKEEISLQMVEDLIEGELESMEKWYALAPDLYQQRDLQRQEEISCLLQLYLQPHLDLFAAEFELRLRECRAERGALFYYPETVLENELMALIFMPKNLLKRSYDYCDRLALPYVSQYNLETEMVVCVRTNDSHNICGIFPKPPFKSPEKRMPITFVEITESLFPMPE